MYAYVVHCIYLHLFIYFHFVMPCYLNLLQKYILYVYVLYIKYAYVKCVYNT